VRKLILSSLIIFVEPGSALQICCALLVSVIALSLVSLFKPFADVTDDGVNFVTFFSLVTTLIVGLQYKSKETLTDTQSLILVLMTLIINVIVGVMSLWLMYLDVKGQYEDNIEMIENNKMRMEKLAAMLAQRAQEKGDSEAIQGNARQLK
jgi:hypothetical protein